MPLTDLPDGAVLDEGTPANPTLQDMPQGALLDAQANDVTAPGWLARNAAVTPYANVQVPGAGGGLTGDLGGLLYGLRQPVDAGASLLAHFFKTVSPPGSTMENWANEQIKNVQDVNQAAKTDYEQNWRQGQVPPVDIPRMVGNTLLGGAIAGSLVPAAVGASMLYRVPAAAAQGAIANTLQPVQENAGTPDADYWSQVGNNAKTGAEFGAAAPFVTAAAARLTMPNAVARNAPLVAAGVNPTAGQLLGGAANRWEEAASSIPGVGDIIKWGRGGAVRQFNTGAINDVLAPIGEKLDGNVEGREALEQMATKVSNAFKSAVPAAASPADAQFAQDLSDLTKMSQFMPATQRDQFQAILRQKVLDQMSPNFHMTGEAIQNADSDIGKLASPYLYNHNSTAPERQLGMALRELQGTMRDWVGRVNPQAASDMGAARQAWARMLPVEAASTRLGQAEPGIFSPANLLAGVKKYSSDSQFMQGKARGQPYAQAGVGVLGNKLPDSGTATRVAMELGGLGLAGGLGHEHLPPEALAATLGSAAGAAGIYSPWGRAALTAALAKRPDWAASLANVARATTPWVAAGMPQLAQ